NRRPNWNDLATAADDPSLDIDVVSGHGPEVISLDHPEPGRPYGAYAHYCDSRGVRLPVNVTFEIWVRGERRFTIPDTGLGFTLAPGEVWRGAQITWTENAGTPMVTVADGLAERPMLAPTLCRLR